jgi:hypothetical protein
VTGFTKQKVGNALAEISMFKPIQRGQNEPMLSYELRDFARECSTEAIKQCAATAVAFPLRVLGTKVTAQMVGRETIYSANPWSGIRAIIAEEGAGSLYKWLFLELAADVTQVVAQAITLRLMNYYLGPLFNLPETSSEEEQEQLKQTKAWTIQNLSYELAVPAHYSLRLMGTILMVNDSAIAAGRSPFSPPVHTISACFDHLRTLPNHRGVLRSIPTVFAKAYG